MADKSKKKRDKDAGRKREFARLQQQQQQQPPRLPSRYTNKYHDPRILEVGGPLVACEWSVPSVLQAHLAAAGRPIPAPVRGQLLLDTGASRTCISRRAAEDLGLTPVRLQKSYGAGGLHESAVFRVKMTVRLSGSGGTTEINWEFEAHEIPLLEESVEPLKMIHAGEAVRLVGLLGRDLLRFTTVTYDGLNGLIDIKFDVDSMRRYSERGKIA